MSVKSKRIFSILLLAVSVVCFTACGGKKHTNCDSYGNKAGQVELQKEDLPS